LKATALQEEGVPVDAYVERLMNEREELAAIVAQVLSSAEQLALGLAVDYRRNYHPVAAE